MNEPLQVGRSTPRIDAAGKAAGNEKYSADYYPENYLVLGLKRSPYPHGRIVSIDTAQAKKTPGVIAVLTHQDISGSNRLGAIVKDQPVLAGETVRFIGDAVALVVAENKMILEKALESIEVQYEILPGVFSSRDALLDNSVKVHKDWKNGNILLEGKIESGNAIEALPKCE